MFKPRKFTSTNGYEILVGRNARENQWLSTKFANATDMFFHAKDFAGSHVILRNPDNNFLPHEDFKDAAFLAAYYSKGKNKKTVKIDFTFAKNVSRNRKDPAGTVILSTHKTLKVNTAEAVARLMIMKVI